MYAVITTTITRVRTKEEAYELALKNRGLGKRTEIVAEQFIPRYLTEPMQNLKEYMEGR